MATVKKKAKTTVSSVEKTERAVNRPKRVPLHEQKALSAKKRDGFVLRYVNDTLGNIEAHQLAGWTIVEDTTRDDSDNRVQNESHMGSIVKKVVNKDPNASCRYAVLMEIPEEWYNEAQKAKQLEVDKIEASYDPAKFKQGVADYGHLKRD